VLGKYAEKELTLDRMGKLVAGLVEMKRKQVFWDEGLRVQKEKF
jgi:hypothetical protein